MAIENFSTYTEVDAGLKITTTSSRVTFANLARTEESYVYKDMTADYFSGDFTHTFTVNISAHTSGAEVAAVWVMANLVDDIRGIDIDSSGDALFLRFIRPSNPDELRLYIYELDGGTLYTGTGGSENVAYYVCDYNTPYYLKIVRNESIGTYGTFYCYIYSDSDRTNLLATLSVALHTSKKDFRYIYPLSVWKGGSAYYISGYIEDLAIYSADAGYAATYPSDAMTRVTGLVHRYSPGNYTLEVFLGDTQTNWDSTKPDVSTKPEETILPKEKKPVVDTTSKTVRKFTSVAEEPESMPVVDTTSKTIRKFTSVIEEPEGMTPIPSTLITLSKRLEALNKKLSLKRNQ